jgi:Domain of unknown function (DUF4126)
MDDFLVITQGAGLAAACGVRPFLPVLAAGLLAAANQGLDFDRTPYAFLERPAFLAAVALFMVVVLVAERRRSGPVLGSSPLAAAVGGVGIGLGALEFAGSLADEGLPAWAGLVAGVACAALAQAAARNFFGRVADRLDPQARGALVVYVDGLALAVAILAVLLPPASLLVLVAFAVLLVRGRRRDERKHAGLRILR